MTDGTYKCCPHKILDEGWDEFKALVSMYLNELNNPKEDESKEDEKPETKPDEKEEEDKIAQTSTLIALLIKLLQKILAVFKQPKGKKKSTRARFISRLRCFFFYAFLCTTTG